MAIKTDKEIQQDARDNWIGVIAEGARLWALWAAPGLSDDESLKYYVAWKNFAEEHVSLQSPCIAIGNAIAKESGA